MISIRSVDLHFLTDVKATYLKWHKIRGYLIVTKLRLASYFNAVGYNVHWLQTSNVNTHRSQTQCASHCKCRHRWDILLPLFNRAVLALLFISKWKRDTGVLGMVGLVCIGKQPCWMRMEVCTYCANTTAVILASGRLASTFPIPPTHFSGLPH